MNKILYSLFTFLVSCNVLLSQSITITSPNGSEVWAGCTSKNITWTASGTSGFYTIDYSTDGGNNWTSVTSFLSNSTGTYSWTVPNINSSNCLVRVKDSNDSTKVDQSNASFTITAPLILTAPDGGEKWEAGTTKSITWAATGTSNRYKIEYSTNGGSSWNTITSNTYNTSGIYNWNVANSPSTSALVRVTDYYTACMTDKSNNLFEIKPPTPTLSLTYPNGFQTLYSGKAYTISWSSSNMGSNLIALDYSTDSGNTWTPIVTGISNSGSHSWTVPNTPSTSCMVKVKAVGTSYADSSDNFFTIKNPYVTVLTPNGSENWEGCNTQTIRWAHGGITNNRFKISYSTNNGGSWTQIVTNYYQSSTTNSSYNWSIPNTIQGSALIKIEDYNNSNTYDQSDTTFNLSKNTSIIVTSPNGGEQWEAGKTKSITWVDNNISRFRVYYSSNGGASFSYITSSTYSNSYNWTIPNSPGNNYLIKVQDYYNSCKADESDSVFSVTPPTPHINVTSPNGNTVYPFQNYTIRWNSGFLTSAFVKIEYSSDSGSTWSVVQSVTNNDGAESWTVPNVISSNCFIRVSEYNNASVYGQNSSPFNIAAPYITLNSPNGGESWKGCESKTISWSVGGGSGTYRLEYSLDSGSTWNIITNRSSTSYNWTLPAKLSSSTALVRVRDLTRGIADTSNAKFSIIPNTDVIITSPNGGESWEAATTKNISWIDNGISRFRVYYSSNGGASYSYITSSTYSNSQNWSVPNNPGNNYKIKVQDYYNSCKYDESDSVFSVTPPQPVITVTAPNSGTLYPQQSYNIRWTSSYLTSSFVKIEFSSDSGSTWSAIASSTANDGIENWTVPNTISTNCFIRISEIGSPSVNDWSGRFTIAQPFITLNSPNGGEVWNGCQTKSISWSVGGGSGTYRLEYSLDTGNTWNYITNRSSTSYSWQIPAKLSSTRAKIRVRDLSRNLSDESNTTFNIIPNTDIIVTSPNGGESWEVGTTKSVTWVDNNISRFRVYYSTNGGSSYSYITSSNYGNAQNWTVPNNPGSNYRVKVEDYYNSCKFDESDSVFTVTPPVPNITVTYPNGGTFYPLQSINIRWTSSYLNSAFVKIEYSSDSMNTWNTVASVSNNDGIENWQIPNVISSNYYIRVSEYGTPSVADTSGKFVVNPPFITLNSPNGGEVWNGCESKNISWTVGGGSGTYRLEYSLDSGSTWNYIANRNGSSYNWTIPAKLSSTKAFIRVRDLSRNISDASNSTFSFVPNTDIIITSPNGGESWEAATTKTITWVDNGVSTAHVYYSTNGGSSWSRLTGYYGTSSNSQSWTVPNSPGSNYKVKVENRSNTCEYDESDSVFTVTPPQPRITVTSPNSGSLYPNQTYTIRWTSAYLNSSFVNIEFSSDSGSTWSSIVSSTSNDGSHSWTVPNSISTNCFIRISEAGSPNVNDWSGRFTISAPYLTLTAPVNGNNWNGCSSQSIRWTVGGGSGSYRLEYSLDSGATWNYITNTSSSSAYTWTIPAKLSSSKARIRIKDNSYSNLISEMSGHFTLVPNNDIIVTSPVGGEQWEASTTKTITWVDHGVSSAHVYYSQNGGSSWSRLTGYYGTSSNALNWSVPNNPGSTYKIKVENRSNSCEYDVSDSNFTVTPPTPYLNLTYPNGNNVLYQGQTATVRWNSGHLTSPYVRLDYSLDSGLTWSTIANVTNNDGAENWTVPNVNSTKALVRVSEYGNPSMQDISASTFTIQPSIVLTAPNGDNGQNQYRGCTVTSIKWNAGGTSRYYRIEYSLNGGSSWVSINSNYYTSSSSPTYNWTMPNTASNNVLVRVRDRNDANKSDQSDNAFTITAPITLNVPNQGGTYYVGDTMYVNWTSNGTSNYYNIDYSTNGGSTWTSIVFNHNTSGNSYAWKIPGTVSNNCLVRITDNIDNCKKTQSVIPFKIVSGSKKITVTAPKGGESWAGCSQKTISWTDNGNSTAYKIQYSNNGGSSWTTIQNSYATSTKTYTWTVPSQIGNSYLVRVSDATDSTKTDQSDSSFTVTNSSVPVVSAIGNTTICGGNSVTLTCDRSSGITWYPGGLTTQSITVTTPASYYVIYRDSGGCSIQSNTVSVTSGTPPAAPTITASGPTKFCLGGSVILSTNQTTGVEWYPGGQTSQTITATQGGNYTVTYTDANGCSSTSQPLTITTNSIPTITRSQQGVCLGDTLTLVSSSSTGNRWFPTGDTTNSIKVTSNGNYYVQVTDSDNCTASSAVDSISFEAKPANPTISASGALAFCPGESVTLTASPKTNITWSTGAQDSSITLDSATTVYATYTNSGGCSSQSNTVTTTLLASPNKPVISAIGDTTFCQGDSVTLVSSATINSWSNGDTASSIVVNSSGFYSTTTTGSNGCKATSKPLLVSVNTIPAKPVISINGDSTFCAGDSVILSSNLTTGNLWSNGDSSTSITVKSAGAFSVKYTNNNGCSNESYPVNIRVNAAPTKPIISSSKGDSFCSGDSTVLSTNFSGTVAWSNGDTASQITVNNSGSFYATAINSNGCISPKSDWQNITVNATPIAPTISLSDTGTLCIGDTLILTSSAANGNLWSNGDSTTSIRVSQTGSVGLKVISNAGCESPTVTQTFTFNTNPPKPSITIQGDSILCSGDSTLLISSSSTGNTWNTSTTSQTFVVKSSGIYSVTVKNPQGCSATSDSKSITVTAAPTNPVISITGDTTFCGGDSVILTSNKITGNQWSNGDTSRSITVKNSGIFSTTYTNSVGCSSKSTEVSITSNPKAPTPVISIVGDTTFCQGDSVVLSSNLLSGNQWSTGDTNRSIVVKSSGNYFVEQTNAFMCNSRSTSVGVQVNSKPAKPLLLVTGDTTFCQGDSAVVSSNYNTGLRWNNGDSSTQIVVKNAGFVGLTHTALNGCSSTSDMIQFRVNSTPLQPTISTNGPTSFCSGDSVVLSSSSNTGNVWSNGDSNSSIVVKNSGNYSLRIKNAQGCESNSTSKAVTVNQKPTSPILTLTGDSIMCQGDSALLSTNYSTGIVWSTSDTTSQIVVKSTGNISVTHTDSNGCSASSIIQGIRVNPVPPTPVISANGSLEFCQGGSVLLTSSSAANNTWSNNDTTNSTTVSTSGLYSVKVRNSFGCEANSASVQVKVNTIPAKPAILITGDTSFCMGDSVVLNTSYSNGIKWSNNDTTQQIVVKSSGIYSVSYTDTNGCKSTSRLVSTSANPIPNTPSVLASGPLAFCDGGSVTLSSSSAGNNTWSTTDTTNSILVKQSGNYSVSVSNQFGCSASSSNTYVQVYQLPAKPSITSSGPTTFCQGDSVLLSSSSLINNVWSTTDTTTSIVAKTTGIYSLFVEDTNGCKSPTASQSVTVSPAPQAPVISASGSLGFCQGDSVLISSNVSTGNVWNNGDSTQSIVVKTSGSYNSTIQNSVGCRATSNTLVVTVGTRPSTPNISVVGSPTFCLGDSVRLVSSSATGNLWSTGDSTGSIVVKSAGNYGLKVTDNGCVSTETKQLISVYNNPAAPVITFTGDTAFCSGDSVVLHSSYSFGNVWSHSAGSTNSITVNSTGNYFVTHTDTNGCSSTSASVSTRVLPAPQAPFVSPSGNVSLCEGDTTTLRSSQSVGIVWNTNQSPLDSLLVLAGGAYYVTYTDANGCTANSNTVNVSMLTPPAQPTITVVGQDLESSTADKYQWYFGGNPIAGAIGKIHRATQNGVYQVEIADNQGCRAISAPETFSAVGIADVEFVESMKLYPNPSTGLFNMDLSLIKTAEIEISVYNTSGQLVYQETIRPESLLVSRIYQLDLANGVYQFELKTEESSYSERLTISK